MADSRASDCNWHRMAPLVVVRRCRAGSGWSNHSSAKHHGDDGRGGPDDRAHQPGVAREPGALRHEELVAGTEPELLNRAAQCQVGVDAPVAAEKFDMVALAIRSRPTSKR